MEEIVGYGFHPTNQQLVGLYLKKKRLDPDYSHPEITEININDHEPSALLGESDASERYFFVRPRYTNTKRKLVKRRTKDGTWKSTGKIPDVKEKRSKKVIGSKRKLVFYEGPSTRNKNARTNYVMDEFHCKPDPLFKADFVVVRIKIKPDDSCDSSTNSENVISRHPSTDFGDLIAEVSQVESQRLPNNYMPCSEDYSADIIFTKDSQPLPLHDISHNQISQSISNYGISPNIISQPLTHHHISLNREPDLLPNQDISFNRGNQPPNNDTSFNREVQPPSNNNLSSILPHPVTSFDTEVQLLANYNLCSVLPHHEISTNREFQPQNYDISFNREYQPLPHDISFNGEYHAVPNYNVSSILPHHDISSNRESQPQQNHSLYPNIEELVTENTSLEVEPPVPPPVPAVWGSVIDYNGLDRNSFYTQQTQIHLQQQQQQVWDSVIDYNGLDQNSSSPQRTQIHLQQQQQQVWDSLIEYNGLDQNSSSPQRTEIHLQQQQQVWDSLIEYNGLDQNSTSAQQMQIHLQQGSSHSCDSSIDSNVLSPQENNWSNLQRDVQFSEKETGHSHTPEFYSTKPDTVAAYVYESSNESALLNGDSSVSNSPLGSEQENNRSNSQCEFHGKETVYSPPSGFNLSMPVIEAHAYGGTGAHAYGGTGAHAYGGSDRTHSSDFSIDSNVLSPQENNRSNLQRDAQFSEKETGHSHTPHFNSTKPDTVAAYVNGSSDESALLNGDSSVSNSPLGSEQEYSRSNSQCEFFGKETVYSPPYGFNLSMPAIEAHAYGGSDKTIDATLIDDEALPDEFFSDDLWGI